MQVEVAIADTLRTIAILLVGASAVRSVQTIRLYYSVWRELGQDQQTIRLLPRHVWKVSIAYLGLALGLALAHSTGFGHGLNPIFVDIPFLAFGLSAINDVYRLQRHRLAIRAKREKREQAGY